MYCRNCGKEIKKDANFCTFCGEKIPENNVSQTNGNNIENIQQTAKKPKTNKKPIIIIISIMIVAILGFCCMDYFNDNMSLFHGSSDAEGNIVGNIVNEEMVAKESGMEDLPDSIKLDEIKEAGKLVLGTSADYPPYEFHVIKDGADAIVGFDIEIAKAIAEDLGVELEIKDMAFNRLLPALDAGGVDLVIAGMTPTEERALTVDFSVVYYKDSAIAFKKGSPVFVEEVNASLTKLMDADMISQYVFEAIELSEQN